MDRVETFLNTYMLPATEGTVGGKGSYKIIAISEKEAQKYCLAPHTQYSIVISIHDPDDPTELRVSDASKVVAVHSVRFADVEDKNAKDAITMDQAIEIKRFVEYNIMHYPVRVIICHCKHGVSRSAGVAAALLNWLAFTNDQEIWEDPTKHPNMLVYLSIYRLHHNGTNVNAAQVRADRNQQLWENRMLEIKKTLYRQEDIDRWYKIWHQFEGYRNVRDPKYHLRITIRNYADDTGIDLSYDPLYYAQFGTSPRYSKPELVKDGWTRTKSKRGPKKK